MLRFRDLWDFARLQRAAQMAATQMEYNLAEQRENETKLLQIALAS